MLSFSEWLQEAVSQHYMWGDEEIGSDKTSRDYLGLPQMQRPGFRKQDKKKIMAGKDQTEAWLNGVTRRYGIHWVIIYGEPNANEPNDEAGWNNYSGRMNNIAGDKFQQFISQWQASHPEERPPTAENTIVYVKPTSRVHPLSAHQQVHNIGHALLGHCQDLKSLMYQTLQEIVQEFQQASGEDDPPSNGEVVLTVARLVKLSSMKRMFDMKPGDFDKPAKALNQTYGSLDEFMYELIAAFFRGKGWIYLKPQEGLSGDLEPNQAIQDHPWGQNRDWAWKALKEDPEIWKDASMKLTNIVVKALKNCTWSQAGRPIYATYGVGGLTTEP